MKKQFKLERLIYNTLNIAGIFLILAFIVYIITDYCHYDSYTNSAPFWVFVLSRSIGLLLPAAALLVFARYFKKQKSIE